jgi:tRNA threonylcarbamoyladenosine modification (KEOPS) complex Cgi121 subunit
MTDETTTGRTMRMIKNEIIEECAKAAEKAWPRAHTYASENADLYRGQDHAVRMVVEAIRALALSTTPREGSENVG